MTILGIDFGTSHTKTTYTRGRTIETNGFPTALVHSLETSDVWVGKHAIEKIGNPKTKFYNQFKKYLPLQEKELMSFGWTGSKTPKEVIGKYFDKIINESLSMGGIKKVALSIPNHWYQDANNTGPETLLDIFESLNIDVSHIYSEPICAAAAYILQSKEKQTNNPYHLLIIDAGGDTINLTLCEVKRNAVNIISRYGNQQINSGSAGIAFDENCVLTAYENQEQGKVISTSSNDFQKLCYTFEQYKINATHKAGYLLNPHFQNTDLKNTPLYKFAVNTKEFIVSFSEVFKVFKPIEQKIIELLESVNVDTKNMSINIDRVLVIGGFGGYPLVTKTISDYFKENKIIIDDIEFDKEKRLYAISNGAFYLAEEQLNIIEPYQNTLGIRTNRHRNFKPISSDLIIIEANKEYAGMTKPKFLETPTKEKIIITVSKEIKTNKIPIYLKINENSPIDIPIQDILSPGNYYIGFQIDRFSSIKLIFVNQHSKEKKEYHLNPLNLIQSRSNHEHHSK